ncbi:hypothetical protein QBC46DRAFT_453175 [Diplogelasinospora grovesii]|uniref:Inhibitor I9 domain-containing protein n=1 Tax=Diplogelasinospora grovesii TaxID=303347 RepID=A0AAN6MYF0_9PEZI|nr:hypothetical protein QBC46DRAFT_453175 [Diplogelasinospora grovesii]
MTGLVKLLTLALAIGAARADATPDPSSAAPAPPQFKSTPIPNHYIVQYHDNISPAARRHHERTVHQAVTKRSNNRGIIRTFTIGSHFQGYHGELDDEQVKALNSSGIIKRINQDAVIRVSSPLLPDVLPHPLPAPHLDRSSALAERDTSGTTYTGSNIRTVQSSTWGQSRISHRLPQSPSPSSPYSYVYESGLTSVYVIDTGIRITHSQFLSPNNNNPSVSRRVA